MQLSLHPVTSLYADTPQPTVTLASSTLHSLSLSWSVTSPQDVSSYVVFWFKESATIGRSDPFHNVTYSIGGLDSNTAYQVIVQANGPLGSTNSTTIIFYTIPDKVQGILPAMHNIVLSILTIIFENTV